MNKINISYNEEKDIVTINGRMFTGDFFREFETPSGYWFKIVEDEEGKIILHRKDLECM